MSTESKLILDCSMLCDPTPFLGKNWKEVDRDERAYAMTQVDYSRCQFMTCIKGGEGPIRGEDVLRRLKEYYPQMIRHGGNQFLALRRDYRKNGSSSVLEYLRQTQGINRLNFLGLILEDPIWNRPCVLSLYWLRNYWGGSYSRLDRKRRKKDLALLVPVS